MQVAGVKAARARGSYQPPTDTEEITVDDAIETTFGLERDLQVAIRHNIHQLDPNLTIIDGGKERTVASGRTDILARDRVGRVVIELKAGMGDISVIGQVLAYVGDLQAEDPAEPVRGVVIAHDFTPRAVSAARAGNIQLMRYGHSFTFERA